MSDSDCSEDFPSLEELLTCDSKAQEEILVSDYLGYCEVAGWVDMCGNSRPHLEFNNTNR